MEFSEEFCVLLDESVCTEDGNCTLTTPAPKKRKKPSVTSPWTYGDINCLILAVEEHPCVWEYSCADYKDRYKREQAWREIQDKLPGHTIEDCKGKWANLKTALQNVKKKLKTKSGQGADNTLPHWPHWSAMQFYSRHDLSKSTCSISTLDVEVIEPGCSTAKTFSPPRIENHDEMMQRAVKYLETEEDHWQTIGTYLASQMRELAKTNKKAANKLHMQLVKTAMEAALEAEEN